MLQQNQPIGKCVTTTALRHWHFPSLALSPEHGERNTKSIHGKKIEKQKRRRKKERKKMGKQKKEIAT